MIRGGLIAHWAKDERIGYNMINARTETLAARSVYTGLLAQSGVLYPKVDFMSGRIPERRESSRTTSILMLVSTSPLLDSMTSGSIRREIDLFIHDHHDPTRFPAVIVNLWR